jgi:hypothetical protein
MNLLVPFILWGAFELIQHGLQPHPVIWKHLHIESLQGAKGRGGHQLKRRENRRKYKNTTINR